LPCCLACAPYRPLWRSAKTNPGILYWDRGARWCHRGRTHIPRHLWPKPTLSSEQPSRRHPFASRTATS